jgi:release factor glutamine methyltransferase
VIVSNPPYIADGFPLESQVVDFEPHVALFGGPSGFSVIDALLASVDRLQAGGTMLLEVGFDQSDAVRQKMGAAGLIDVQVHADLAGIGRVVSGRMPQ